MSTVMIKCSSSKALDASKNNPRMAINEKTKCFQRIQFPDLRGHSYKINLQFKCDKSHLL